MFGRSANLHQGVGYAMKEPQFLKPDDVVEVNINAIGTLRNTVQYA